MSAQRLHPLLGAAWLAIAVGASITGLIIASLVMRFRRLRKVPTGPNSSH